MSARVRAVTVETKPREAVLDWCARDLGGARTELAGLARRLRHGNDVVFCVTSPRRLDARSPCSLGLALALAADDEEPTLLVEVDTARPWLSEALGLAPPGSLERPSPGAAREWVAASLEGLGIHVVAADAGGEVPHLGRGVLAALVSAARASAYRRVVLDAPSVLDRDDWSAAVDTADAVVLVVESLSTRLRDLRRAAELLAPAPVRAVVVVG